METAAIKKVAEQEVSPLPPAPKGGAVPPSLLRQLPVTTSAEEETVLCAALGGPCQESFQPSWSLPLMRSGQNGLP